MLRSEPSTAATITFGAHAISDLLSTCFPLYVVGSTGGGFGGRCPVGQDCGTQEDESMRPKVVIAETISQKGINARN
jgi:hypothetical protein